jgi:hypothetical protein
MKAWDIFSWQAPGWPEPQPAVIVSHPDRVANKPEVTVIMRASRGSTRQPEPNEVILDANDGLEWLLAFQLNANRYVLQSYSTGGEERPRAASRRQRRRRFSPRHILYCPNTHNQR